MSSSLERTFAYYWRALAPDAPEPTPEYRFAPPRRWRFDYAWPDARVAVELEGGVHSGGRHVRGAGFERDAEKYNAAAASGWRVLRYTGGMLKRDPVACVEQVRELLAA